MDREDFSNHRTVRMMLNCALLSTNAIHTFGNRRVFMSEKATRFKKEFLFELDPYMDKLLKFSAIHSELKCPIHSTIIFHHPKVYKKDGSINLRGGDLTNFLKLMEDCLFRAISVDDAYHVRTTAEKVQSILPKIEIILTLVAS